MLLAVLAIACLGANETPAPADLRIMTFNVRYGAADDGENAWDNRKDILVDVIRNHEPVLVGTQECLDFQIEYMAEQLPDYGWFGIGKERDGSDESCAVLYNKKKLVPVEIRTFWLSETPDVPGSKSWDTAETRLATTARFWVPTGGFYFYYINTHLDHRGEVARANAINLITEHVATLPESMPIIIGGDFNAAAETSAPWVTATNAGLRDSWLEAPEKSGPRYTSHGFRPLDETKVRRIDWILVRGPITVSRSAVLTDNVDGRFPSDHFPVTADIRITPPTPE